MGDSELGASGSGWSVINAVLGTTMLSVAGLAFADPEFGQGFFGRLVGFSGIPVVSWHAGAVIAFVFGFCYLVFLTPPRTARYVDEWERDLYPGGRN